MLLDADEGGHRLFFSRGGGGRVRNKNQDSCGFADSENPGSGFFLSRLESLLFGSPMDIFTKWTWRNWRFLVLAESLELRARVAGVASG